MRKPGAPFACRRRCVSSFPFELRSGGEAANFRQRIEDNAFHLGYMSVDGVVLPMTANPLANVQISS
jgi:hypothetical protein